LGDGDVLRSPVALAFYELFVFEPRYGEAVPDIDWEADERDLETLLNQYTDDDLKDILAGEYLSYQMLSNNARSIELIGRQLEERLATDIDPKLYEAYVGKYEVPTEIGWPFATVVVASEDYRLYVELPMGEKLELFPESETSFFHLSIDGTDDFEVTFVRDETGEVSHAILEKDGMKFAFKRINTQIRLSEPVGG
jgi:hypothetical protein